MRDRKFKSIKQHESNLMRDAKDYDAIMDILNTNSDKEFVKRIINPNSIDPLDNKDGSISTHSMAYAGVDDGAIVYPTVVNMGGKLVRLSDQEALDYAKKTKEAIMFNDEKNADWFSRNYKKVWDK